jgi:hypothetical protein
VVKESVICCQHNPFSNQKVRKNRMNLKRISNLYIIAGPNGSGNTIFVEKFLPSYAGCIHFVNADLIAAVKAGKIMLEEIPAYARQGSDFFPVPE